MGGFFEDGTETAVQSNIQNPWQPAQAPLKKGLSEAERLYDAGEGFNPYEGQRAGTQSQICHLVRRRWVSLWHASMDKPPVADDATHPRCAEAGV